MESRLLTNREWLGALADETEQDGMAALRAQDAKTDKLSREDERKKIAAWLQGDCSCHKFVGHPHTRTRRLCLNTWAKMLLLLSEGKPLEGE